MAPTNNRVNPNAPTRAATENLVQVLDTYVRPQRDTMGEQALAQGFNAMGQTLGQYSRRELSRELTETATQANADALAGNDPNEEFAQVRLGNIFRPHSRAYMDAYNATMGRVAAIEFRDSTTLAYAESGLDRNTDPEAFREWYGARLQEFMGQNDNPYFMAGAMPLVEQATFNLSAQHTGNIVRTLQANRAAAARTLAAEATMNTMGEWQRLENQRVQFETSNPEWAADIASQQAALIAHAVNGVSSDFYGTGDAGTMFRGATLDGALDYAEATGNMELVRSIGAAAHSGGLRLTPGEMLDLTNRSQRIRDDHLAQLRAEDFLMERGRRDNQRLVSDFAADMAMDPANLGMTARELLANNPTLQALISQSDDSAHLISSFEQAWDAVTGFSTEITATEGFENEVDFRQAITQGVITNPATALEWIREQQAGGRVFSDGNMNTFMQLATQAASPSGNSILTNGTFNGAISVGTRMAVADLVADPVFDAYGNTSDATALFIQNAVTSYMQDRAGTLDVNSPTYAQDVRNLRDQAIIAAHEEFQALSPTEYDNRYQAAIQSEDGALALLSPGWLQEHSDRQAALATAAAEEGASLDAAISAGSSILFDEEVPGEPSVPPTGAQPEPTTTEATATEETPAEEISIRIPLTNPPSQEDMVMPFDEFEGMDTPPNPEPSRQEELDALVTTLSQYEDVIANGGSIYTSDIIELTRAILALPTAMVPREVRLRAAELQRANQ